MNKMDFPITVSNHLIVIGADAVKKNPSQLDKVKAWTPMHRLASPDEIAGPIVFLCMPASSYVMGQVLSVDGGLTAQGFDGPCVTEE